MQLPTPSSEVAPLWIIALFIALSESVAGVAAIATDGATRLIFAIFAVSFPLGVLGVFVYLLKFESTMLFGPAAFTKGSPEDWQRATERDRLLRVEYRQLAVKSAVKTIPGMRDDPAARAELTDQVSENFDRALEEASVTVDLNALKPGADPLQIPVTKETTVDFLLDTIYFAIAPAVEPFTYSRNWILSDDTRGQLSDMGMGTIWAKKHNLIRDDRLLSAVGISPGSELKAIPLGNRGPKGSPFQRRLNRLITTLAERLDEEGLEVERVSGTQRPRLLTFDGTTPYGLYVMPGKPDESWIKLANSASSRVGRDRDELVQPVLVLDTRPAASFVRSAEQSGVLVMWLTGDVIRNAPWGDRPADDPFADGTSA